MNARHARIAPGKLLGFDLPKRGPEGISAVDRRKLLARLKAASIDWSLLGPQVEFHGAAYLRKRLFRSRDWEVLALCWLPGQSTVIHDHGRSWGATLVVAGEIEESLFRWNGEGLRMDRRVSRPLGVSQVTVETLETVHRVANPTAAPAVSLHLYSPPLDSLRSYDEESGRRHVVRPNEGPSVAVGGRPGRAPRVPARKTASR